MSLIKEGVWTRPYEQYSTKTLRENMQLLTSMRVKDDVLREVGLPYLDINNLTIDFDHPYVSDVDYRKDRKGSPIYYPIREPNADEIVRRERAGASTVTAAKGFASLHMVLFPEEDDYIQGDDIIFYQQRINLRIRNKYFDSYPDLDISEKPFAAYFLRWVPQRIREVGSVYIPVDLPSLRLLEFRLERLNYGFLSEVNSPPPS